MVSRNENTPPKSYVDAVRELTVAHGEALQPGDRIFIFDDPAKREVRLLEVTSDTVPTGVMPVAFRPQPEFPFRSVIVQITPQEWQSIEQGRLALPEGWDLASKRTAWPTN
ncbi:MAG: hypothetical protein K2W85_13780 [Phycisphaerales bacterium]|nr:hypothetical protein [Phycisphaerales bacterium]